MFHGTARFLVHDGLATCIRPPFIRDPPTVEFLRLDRAGIVPTHTRAIGDCEVQTRIVTEQEYRDIVDPRIEVSRVRERQPA